jgi:hypothetical protein
MADVFISYARDNQAAVRVLAEAVKRAGYSVWWDEELPPHLSYGDVIAEKIGSAKAAIVVWSESAAASEWVRAEADVARNQKKLIQTSIDARQPPMPFNQIQFAAIGDWQGEDDHPGWRKVKESLAALCGPAEPTEASARAYAFPATPPPPAPAAPRPERTQQLLVALLAVLILIILAGGALLLMRGGRHHDRDRPGSPASGDREAGRRWGGDADTSAAGAPRDDAGRPGCRDLAARPGQSVPDASRWHRCRPRHQRWRGAAAPVSEPSTK